MQFLESILQDLRIALRVLSKSPAATALSVLSIALGIGLTASMFSIGDAMLLRPLPIQRPGELLKVTSRGDDDKLFLYGWPDFIDMSAAGSSLSEFAASQRRGLTLAAGDETESVLASPITPNYFSLLGVRAMLGLASVDPLAGHPQVVLGYRFGSGVSAVIPTSWALR